MTQQQQTVWIHVIGFAVLIFSIEGSPIHDNLTKQADRSGNVSKTVNAQALTNRIFSVKALTKPTYILRSVCVEVESKHCDSELEFRNSLNDAPHTSFLSNLLKTFARRFFYQSSESGYSYQQCLSPYNDLYFSVKLHQCHYNDFININIRYLVSLTCLACLIAGVFLFFAAHKLSKSMSFYYSSATGFGVLASALIVVFILSRFIPKKPAAYSVLVGGWSICAWMLTKLWNNLSNIIIDYYPLVIGYVILSGFVSFALCYRYGGVTDSRSRSIVQWSIQIASIILVYNGTQLTKASLSIIVFLITCQLFSLLPRFQCLDQFRKRVARRKKPHGKPLFNRILGRLPFFGNQTNSVLQTPHLLTEEEYHIQGKIETEKALKELRQYCRSPECSPWKTLSRIETPKRLAQFVDGSSHLSLDEISQYDQDMAGVSDSEDEEQDEVTSSLLTEDDDSLDPSNFKLGDLESDIRSNGMM